jgi:DNA-binding NarL/FixJ family response regulator
MKALLMYNDNIAPQLVIDFERELGSTYKYQVDKQELLSSDFTIDKKIDNILKTEIDNCKYDCIFIPYSLSEENYLEFTGLRFACHIRLTPEFNNLQTPIVFFGYETENEINKLSEIGAILFSRGVYTTDKISVHNFEMQVKYVKDMRSEISDELFLKQFTNRVNISPSGNYATHHSITNEWSIYRWATALKIDDEYIQKIEKNIGSNLYFKYLKAQFPVKETVDAKNQIIIEQGNILYIDDEVEKGWDSIFKKICIHKKYESIGADFKNMDSLKIVEVAIEKVKEFEPDVVILDFRLHDDDFENITPEKVTGYRILREIKEINEGIQVIILSATNKIWNLLELQKTDINGFAGADGFILKESPELSVDGSYSKDAVSKIYKTINESLSKKYLKEIYKAWKESILTTGNTNEKFISESKVALETAWKLIKSEHLDMGFLTIYQAIERHANKLYQTEDNQDSIDETTVIEKSDENENIWKLKYNKDEINGDYFCGSDHAQSKTQRPTTLFKVSCLFYFIYKYNNNQLKEIGKLNQIRNNIAHGKTKPKDQKQHSKKNDFVKLLILLMTIRKN